MGLGDKVRVGSHEVQVYTSVQSVQTVHGSYVVVAPGLDQGRIIYLIYVRENWPKINYTPKPLCCNHCNPSLYLITC